jgi:hypothetical protein
MTQIIYDFSRGSGKKATSLYPRELQTYNLCTWVSLVGIGSLFLRDNNWCLLIASGTRGLSFGICLCSSTSRRRRFDKGDNCASEESRVEF